MGKRSKSKRFTQKGKDAVQPNNGKERITISKIGGEFENQDK